MRVPQREYRLGSVPPPAPARPAAQFPRAIASGGPRNAWASISPGITGAWTKSIARPAAEESGGDRHRFISALALDPSWMEAVPDGLPKARLIMAEGLLMYFEQAQVQALLDQIKQRFPGATLAFDAVGGVTKGNGAKQLAKMGAPLKWFVTTEADVAAMGLRLVEVRSLLQENCRHCDRIGPFRWVPWLSQLPPLRNAGLVIEARV